MTIKERQGIISKRVTGDTEEVEMSLIGRVTRQQEINANLKRDISNVHCRRQHLSASILWKQIGGDTESEEPPESRIPIHKLQDWQKPQRDRASELLQELDQFSIHPFPRIGYLVDKIITLQMEKVSLDKDLWYAESRLSNDAQMRQNRRLYLSASR